MVVRVNEIYKQLFEQDPLLLDEESQRTFGAQILENLLVERGIKSALPHLVNLGSSSSIAAFRKSDELPPEEISNALRERYLASLRTRTELDGEDVETLKTVTMVARANFTSNRNGDLFADHDRAVSEMKGALSSLEKRIRIAAIGYRVSISRIQEDGLLNEELCPMPPKRLDLSLSGLAENKTVQKLRRTVLRDKLKQPPWQAAIGKHLRHAFERKSHLIVLPEFCLPPNVSERAVEETISEVVANYDHTYFLFSGTRHEGVHNRGFIISRASSKEKPSNRWWHYKTASARGLGENVMGPQNAKIPSYKFNLASPANDVEPIEYRIFVPICYDVFDPTTFINYVAGCADADGRFYESIILVPSFNPGREFVHALRDLSFIASSLVVYVNGLHGDAELFLYGINVSDLAAIEREPLHSDRSVRVNTSIERKLAKLQVASQKVSAEYRSLEDVDYDPVLHQSVEDHRIALSDRRSTLKARIRALSDLRDDIDQLRSRGALKHIITTEVCESCGKQNHGDSAYCSKDVLYFNLDPDLLAVLSTFRKNYFGREEFLPPPFRTEGKRKIREMIKEQNDQRQQARLARRAPRR